MIMKENEKEKREWGYDKYMVILMKGIYKGSRNVRTLGCVSFMFDKKGQSIVEKENFEWD